MIAAGDDAPSLATQAIPAGEDEPCQGEEHEPHAPGREAQDGAVELALQTGGSRLMDDAQAAQLGVGEGWIGPDVAPVGSEVEGVPGNRSGLQ